MGELLVKNKDIVVPGEELAIGIDFLPAEGTFREGDKIIAFQLGLVNVSGRLIKVIPLGGKYLPKKGDIVIGEVINLTFSNWFVNIGCANNAVLSVREATEYIDRGADLAQYYNFGDVIVAKVTNVTRSAIDISMKGPGLKKLLGGKLMKVMPSKVPRIIGRQGSMVSLIKDATNCRIIVGQNGFIWIQGNNPNDELIASEAISKVEERAHIDGLTDEIKNFIESRYGRDKNVQEKK